MTVWIVVCRCAFPIPAGWPAGQPVGGFMCRCGGWKNQPYDSPALDDQQEPAT
jgi:hypothetical protein